MKYKWKDIKIGDTVLTNDGIKGKIIMIRSYAYINDKIIRCATDISTILIDFMPFKYDNVRHKGIEYPAITIAAEVTEYEHKTYYIVDIDFNDIKAIITDDTEITEVRSTNRFLKSLKNFLNKYIKI